MAGANSGNFSSRDVLSRLEQASKSTASLCITKREKFDFKRRNEGSVAQKWSSGTKIGNAVDSDYRDKGLNLPKTKEEIWNDKLSGWNKRRAYKELASNVLAGREVQRNDSKDQTVLREAEDALSALQKYVSVGESSPPKNGFHEALKQTNMYKDAECQMRETSGAKSLSSAVSVADIRKLRDESRARAAAANLALFAEKSSNNNEEISNAVNSNKGDSSLWAVPSPKSRGASGSGARPRSAGVLGRRGSTNIELESVRRHNDSRAKLQLMKEEEQREARRRSQFKARPMPGSDLYGPNKIEKASQMRPLSGGTSRPHTVANTTSRNRQVETGLLSELNMRTQDKRTPLQDTLDVATTGKSSNFQDGRVRINEIKSRLNDVDDDDNRNDVVNHHSTSIRGSSDTLDDAISNINTLHNQYMSKHVETSLSGESLLENDLEEGDSLFEEFERVRTERQEILKRQEMREYEQNIETKHYQDSVTYSSPTFSKYTDSKNIDTPSVSLFPTLLQRQDDWKQKIDQKRELLRQEILSKKERNYHGKPDVQHAQESWERAKVAHAIEAEKHYVDEEKKMDKKQAVVAEKIQSRMEKIQKLQQNKKIVQKKQVCLNSKVKSAKNKEVENEFDLDDEPFDLATGMAVFNESKPDSHHAEKNKNIVPNSSTKKIVEKTREDINSLDLLIGGSIDSIDNGYFDNNMDSLQNGVVDASRKKKKKVFRKKQQTTDKGKEKENDNTDKAQERWLSRETRRRSALSNVQQTKSTGTWGPPPPKHTSNDENNRKNRENNATVTRSSPYNSIAQLKGKQPQDEELERMRKENEILHAQLAVMEATRESANVPDNTDDVHEVEKEEDDDDDDDDGNDDENEVFYVSDSDSEVAQSPLHSAKHSTKYDQIMDENADVSRSIEVSELEKVLGNAKVRGQKLPPPVPFEWPDNIEGDFQVGLTETNIVMVSSPERKNSMDKSILSPRQKLDLLRSLSRSPKKQDNSGSSELSNSTHVLPDFPRFPTGSEGMGILRVDNNVGDSGINREQETSTLQRFRSSRLEREGETNGTASLSARAPNSGRNDPNDPFAPFFGSSSTSDKGRVRLQEARDFVTDSLVRKADILHDGVTLLMGVRRGKVGADSSKSARRNKEEIITLLFDRSEFSERSAKEWWMTHKERLL